MQEILKHPCYLIAGNLQKMCLNCSWSLFSFIVKCLLQEMVLQWRWMFSSQPTCSFAKLWQGYTDSRIQEKGNISCLRWRAHLWAQLSLACFFFSVIQILPLVCLTFSGEQPVSHSWLHHITRQEMLVMSAVSGQVFYHQLHSIVLFKGKNTSCGCKQKD